MNNNSNKDNEPSKFFITGLKLKGFEFGSSNNGPTNPTHSTSEELKKKYEKLEYKYKHLKKEVLKHKIINLKYSLDVYQKNVYSIEYFMKQRMVSNLKNTIDFNNSIIDRLQEQYYCFENIPNKYLQENMDISYTKSIENLKDLIQFSKHLKIQKNIHTNIDSFYPNINVDEVIDICSSLEKLDSMVGMKQLKQSVFEQIIFYLQKLDIKNKDYLHTCIYGPPGTGKTEIAHIIGEIFSKLHILKNNIFKKATRADLVGEYLGQTAIKVRNLVKSCIGGVLFIDEAYSLGNDKKDSFSKEAFDTLNELLSYHNDDLMVIVAGYKDEMKQYFFKSNPGLESRFSWIYEIENYSGIELSEIFIKKITENEWCLDKEITSEDTPNYIQKWFETHKTSFVSYGRDIEVLFSKIKISHSKRLIHTMISANTCHSIKKHITKDDLEKGFELFTLNTLDNKEEHMKDYLKNSIYI